MSNDLRKKIQNRIPIFGFNKIIKQNKVELWRIINKIIYLNRIKFHFK